jgi:L-fuconolactonase
MLRIDAHQHFWNYDAVEHGWMTDQMYTVKKNFLPADLKPLLEQNNLDGTVLVQVTQSHEETEILLEIAESNDFIKGVVGWVDLRDNNIHSRLDYYKKYPKLKGFRHILQAEEPDFMLHPDFFKGISALRGFDFTYDILIYPKHLEAALKLVKKFPEQFFVVDHLAKPDIKNNNITEWERGIRLLASCPNVYCKISGMVTEADWKNWKQDNFTPYMDVVVNAFGIDRVMYGSDWPMCLVAASYKDVLKIATDYFSSFSTDEQKLFFGENAVKFYQL